MNVPIYANVVKMNANVIMMDVNIVKNEAIVNTHFDIGCLRLPFDLKRLRKLDGDGPCPLS